MLWYKDWRYLGREAVLFVERMLRNVGNHSPDDRASRPRRPESSTTPPRWPQHSQLYHTFSCKSYANHQGWNVWTLVDTVQWRFKFNISLSARGQDAVVKHSIKCKAHLILISHWKTRWRVSNALMALTSQMNR